MATQETEELDDDEEEETLTPEEAAAMERQKREDEAVKVALKRINAEARLTASIELQKEKANQLESERRKKHAEDQRMVPWTLFVSLLVSRSQIAELRLRPVETVLALQQAVAAQVMLPMLPRIYIRDGTGAVSATPLPPEAMLRDVGVVRKMELLAEPVQAIVSASQDGTARLWNAETGHFERKLEGHEGFVYTAKWSPNSKWIVTASEDGTAKTYNSYTGECERTFRGHTDAVYVAAFASDSKTVVTGSGDGTARLWTVKMEDCLKTYKGHTGAIYYVGFTADGLHVTTIGRDTTTRLWSRATGICDRIMPLAAEPQYSISYSVDGRYFISVTGDRCPKMISVETNECFMELSGHTDIVLSADFSPKTDFKGGPLAAIGAAAEAEEEEEEND